MALDPYEQLGVERDATDADIRRAYRRRASQLHPDRNPDDPYATTRFQLLQEAHGILSDPARRAAYDAGGVTPTAAEIEQRAMAAIRSIFFAELQKGTEQLVVRTRAALQSKLAEARRAEKTGAGSISALHELRLRIDSRAKRNVLDEIIVDAIAHDTEALTELRKEIGGLTAAMQLLVPLSDAQPSSLFITFGTGTGGSTTL